METLHRTGQVDPSGFLALPPAWQRLHLAHTKNHIIGQYEAGEDEVEAASGAELAKFTRELREKRLREGPSPEEVAQAERVLAAPHMPEVVRRAAIETLQRAEAA